MFSLATNSQECQKIGQDMLLSHQDNPCNTNILKCYCFDGNGHQDLSSASSVQYKDPCKVNPKNMNYVT